MYEPWNALDAPRFTGPRTFARLPFVQTLDGAEAAEYGIPWDGGTSFRSGARFGPEAIRSASGMIHAHGTMFRRAIEEGVLDPSRMIQAGMRGPLYGEEDEAIPGELGVETISWIELSNLSAAEFAARAVARVGAGTAFLSLDVDFVDAAFCPGTGTPEVAGPSSFEAMQYLRSLAEIPFVGYDVVEVAPQYDGPGQVTALFAANAIFEMLSMVARRKRDHGGRVHG